MITEQFAQVHYRIRPVCMALREAGECAAVPLEKLVSAAVPYVWPLEKLMSAAVPYVWPLEKLVSVLLSR